MNPSSPLSVTRSLALAFLAAAATSACNKNKDTAPTVQTVAVTRRTIIIDAEATGAVEPINVVEVKSKASGMITRMTVETGTLVKPGDLLVQIDTRDVQNQYNQANADLKAAQAKLEVSGAQKKRNDEMFKARVITAQEHEATSLDYESAKAALVRAEASLDLAKQRLEDATVSASVSGTILEKSVSLGQVITSATSSASGGTTLLKMADLGKVRVRALFNETDIGQVRPGQSATVTVDAYPDRRFQGSVEKIEPQAVIQQNVTMFPVLVALDNREGFLKPGMNGEVSVLVEQLNDVLAVPNDAIKNVREATVTATMLGLSPDSVQAEIQAQFANRGRVSDASSGAAPRASRLGGGSGEVTLASQVGLQGQQGQQGPEVTDKDCAAVTAAFAKKPDARKKLDDLRAKARSGEIDFQAIREESQKIYASLGLDARVAGACRRREMMANGGQSGAGGATRGDGARGGATQNGAQPGRQGGGQLQLSTPETPPAGRRARQGVVFVADSAKKTYHPRVVTLGLANFDYTEILSGVREGEKVALLAAVSLQAQRQQQNDRMRQGMGVPGMTQPGGGGAARPGGGAAGAPRGGAR
jgi:HlyD family secretion protein